MRTIWVVEDDYLQRETICKEIKAKFNVNMLELDTEYKFRHHLENLIEPYPDLIILDVMLPWTLAMRDMPEAPDEVKKNGFYRAGIRCENLVRNRIEIKNIPIIIYTMLDKDDIEDCLKNLNEHTIYLGKSGEIDGLLELIKI